jgi:septal ring factor EnvC (AmiA/AmiB activator)
MKKGEGRMPHKQIKQTINELKTELEQTPKETGFLEEKLEQAREEIERYTPEALQEFGETLQREADEFEVEHPRITALINQVMTALSNLGI